MDIKCVDITLLERPGGFYLRVSPDRGMTTLVEIKLGQVLRLRESEDGLTPSPDQPQREA